MPKNHEEMSNDRLAHPYGVEFFGPVLRETHDVLVDGKRVPYLTVHQEPGNPDGEWWLYLDNRFGIGGSDDEIRKWVRFLADYGAISAGYVSFGRDKRLNPFNRAVNPLSSEEMQTLQDEN